MSGVQGQWGIGAVDKLHRGEHQFGGADVFDVVQQVFAFGETKVPCLAGFVVDIACGSVGGMLSARTGIDRGSKVVEHMAVGVPPLSWLQTDLPNSNPVRFAQ